MLVNPYPGLRPFHEAEEPYFFGRERQVDQMVDRLAEHRFLAVIGASGCGKSSLVNCGLRPALHRGRLSSAGTRWRMARFRPGRAPVKALARCLAENGLLFDTAPEGLALEDVIEGTLRLGRSGLVDIVGQARLNATNLLLVVDQFEELFRYGHGKGHDPDGGVSADARAMVALILEASRQRGLPIYVVITMRSDFLGDCAKFAELPEALNTAQYLVPRMTRDERRMAIVGPARVVGSDVSPVLVTRLLNDAGDNPDQLSLLQHALRRTFDKRRAEGGARSTDAGSSSTGRRTFDKGPAEDGPAPLRLEDYEAIGAMDQALHLHAEEAYSELVTADNQRACEKIFKALTDRVSDPRGVRRPTTLSELCAITGTEVEIVRKVVETFREPSRSFLMPPPPEALHEEAVIDISHESLMRVWARVDAWATEEARSVDLYRRLSQDAALHERGERSLWRDPELGTALSWLQQERPTAAWGERYAPGFAQAVAFLKQSADARKRRVRRRRLAIGLAFGMVVAATLLWAGIEQQQAQAAQKQARLAESNASLASQLKREAERRAELSREKEQEVARQADTLRSEKKRLEGELEAFFVKNPHMRQEVQKLRKANRDLIVQILQTQEENLVLTDQVAAAKGRRKDLAQAVESHEKQVKTLQEDLEAVQAAVISLRNKRTQLEAEAASAQKRLKRLRDENERLREALIAKGFLPPPLDGHGSGYGSGAGAMRGSSGRAVNTNATIAEDDRLATLARKNAQLRARLTAFRHEARLLELLEKEHLEWKRRLESNLADLQEKNTMLEKSLASLRARINQLQERLRKLSDKRSELRLKLEDLEQEEARLESSVRNLEQQVGSIADEAGALRTENEQLNDALKAEP